MLVDPKALSFFDDGTDDLSAALKIVEDDGPSGLKSSSE